MLVGQTEMDRARATTAAARALRLQLRREHAQLREQHERRMVRSAEQLRLTGDLLIVLARERGAEGGRYRT